MFGSWVKVLRPISNTESSANQEELWQEHLHTSFPGVISADADRIRIGNQLYALRNLRNQVSHYDNPWTVNVRNRLKSMLPVDLSGYLSFVIHTSARPIAGVVLDRGGMSGWT